MVRERLKAVVTIGSLAMLMALTRIGPSQSANSEIIDARVMAKVQAATFEVVAAKPVDDPLTYEKPLPLELLPFQERNDKYYSIGTAFAIDDNLYVTAAHVLIPSLGSLWGPPALRDVNGHVHVIDKIEKFSFQRDFAVFSLADHPVGAPFETNTNPELNGVVHAVGNALGTGVVIRDGLYTSNTPEEQDGRWNFMRFSAAASPGNSGGPLLDKDGKVIGIVLRKSPNENLNFALPIAEILNAPDHLADIDSRGTYRIDMIDTVKIGTFKSQFALPLGVTDFGKALQAAQNNYWNEQLAALLAMEANGLFPRGNGSHRLLYSASALRTFPALLARSSDGVWGQLAKPGEKTQTGANGYVQLGLAGQNLMFRWRRPDTLSTREAYSDPDKLMGDLLKTGFLKRPITSEQIKITALGKPIDESLHTDAWQRRWQVRIWPLPYANAFFLSFALPVPDGYVAITQITPSNMLHGNLAALKVKVDFVDVAYEGTLPQWKDFLDMTPLLPSVLKSVRIDFTEGERFRYLSPRLAFSLKDDVLPITPNNVLTLGLSYFSDNGKVVWDVSDVRLKRTANDNDWVNFQRHIMPSEDLDDSYLSVWTKIAHKQHPFDSVIRTENDVTKITATIGENGRGEASPIYTAFVGIGGTRTQETMQAKLEALLQDCRIEEH